MFSVREIEIETPSDAWAIRSADAPASLAGFVKQFWEYVGDTPAGFHKIIPDGNVRIILNLGDEGGYAKTTYDEHARAGGPTEPDSFCDSAVKRSWVSGLFDQPLLIAPTKRADRRATHLLAADMQPWALHGLFDAPAHEFRNCVIELEDVFGKRIDFVRERAASAATTEERFSEFSKFLFNLQSICRTKLNPKTIWAIERITRMGGSVRIGELCDELDITRKHLAALFKDTTGITPKKFSRLMKFKSAVAAIDETRFVRDSELAYAIGYTDQSHFIREFSAFAGETPAAYRQDTN